YFQSQRGNRETTSAKSSDSGTLGSLGSHAETREEAKFHYENEPHARRRRNQRRNPRKSRRIAQRRRQYSDAPPLLAADTRPPSDRSLSHSGRSRRMERNRTRNGFWRCRIRSARPLLVSRRYSVRQIRSAASADRNCLIALPILG